MCHFLPVYYLEIAFLGRGEGSKYNTRILIKSLKKLSLAQGHLFKGDTVYGGYLFHSVTLYTRGGAFVV